MNLAISTRPIPFAKRAGCGDSNRETAWAPMAFSILRAISRRDSFSVPLLASSAPIPCGAALTVQLNRSARRMPLSAAISATRRSDQYRYLPVSLLPMTPPAPCSCPLTRPSLLVSVRLMRRSIRFPFPAKWSAADRSTHRVSRCYAHLMPNSLDRACKGPSTRCSARPPRTTATTEQCPSWCDGSKKAVGRTPGGIRPTATDGPGERRNPLTCGSPRDRSTARTRAGAGAAGSGRSRGCACSRSTSRSGRW